MTSSSICPFSTDCSGCSQWGILLTEQRLRKHSRLEKLLNESGFSFGLKDDWSWADLDGRSLRDRLDFQIREGRRGLWNKAQNEILDLSECWQLSSSLQDWLTDFRRLAIPLSRGSFRLRVSPQGLRGVWLDLANEDVKALFDERRTLEALSESAIVEIGQRRKRFEFENDFPKLLKNPVFETWTRTWVGDDPFLIFSRIADFSQVGDRANREIIRALQSLLPLGRHLVEFGSGSGNLTFAATKNYETVTACESDSAAALGFEKSLKHFEKEFPALAGRVQLQVGDFQKKTADLSSVDTILVNPPRSGVGGFLSNLGSAVQTSSPSDLSLSDRMTSAGSLSRVENLIYMSCYPESMARDLAPLAAQWKISRSVLIDQFPQTDHLEVMLLLQRR